MINNGDAVFEEETPEWDEDAVYDLCWARMTMTDSEWEDEAPAWNISREEAAKRIETKDYSAPF